MVRGYLFFYLTNLFIQYYSRYIGLFVAYQNDVTLWRASAHNVRRNSGSWLEDKTFSKGEGLVQEKSTRDICDCVLLRCRVRVQSVTSQGWTRDLCES